MRIVNAATLKVMKLITKPDGCLRQLHVICKTKINYYIKKLEVGLFISPIARLVHLGR